MSGLGAIFAGALFAGLLMSGGEETVRVPKSEWNDDVGESIQEAVKSGLSAYNSALKDCNSSLLNVKYKAEGKALEVNFSSKKNDLEWFRRQIDAVDLAAIENDINRI